MKLTLLTLVLTMLLASCGGGGGSSASKLSVAPEGDGGGSGGSGTVDLSAAMSNLEEVPGGVELTMLVSNNGTGDSAACFGKYTAVSMDGTFTYVTNSVTIPAIPAGDQYTWVINISFSSVPGGSADAHFYITHFVDSTEIVDETDDDNNQDSVEVDAAALPDAIMAAG